MFKQYPRDLARWQGNVDGEFEKLRGKKKTVYVLQHVRQSESGPEDVKMIGVYSERQCAEAAIERLRAKPGFRDASDGFAIDEYEIDRDHWTGGYGEVD